MRTLIIVVVIVVVLGLIGSGMWYSRVKAGGDGDATVVRIEPPHVGELVEVVSAPGLIEPETKVSISARVSARIVELPFEEGDQVKKDESILVKLDSRDLDAQLRAVEARSAAQAAQIEMARSQLDSRRSEIIGLRAELAAAERELRRQEQAQPHVSVQAVDQARSKLDQLNARLDSSIHDVEASEKNLLVMQHQLEAAQAEIARASDNLTYTTIVSPIDGVVTKLNAEVGELVVTGTMNNPGTVIIEVADLSKMLVKARVDETSIADLEVGQRAKVNIQAYDDEVFEGVVQSVALASTEEKDGSKYYKVEILLDNNGRRVLSGLTADVDVETRRHADVLKIPSQAVLGRRVDDLPISVRDLPEVDKNVALAPVVYRFVNGKAVVTPVKVGPSDMTHTVILSGLSPGEAVVVGPYKVLEGLAHDQNVKDEKQAATTQPADDTTIAKTNGRTADAAATP